MCKGPETRGGGPSRGSETSPQGCSKLGWEEARERRSWREKWELRTKEGLDMIKTADYKMKVIST